MTSLTAKRREIDTLIRDVHQARERLEASERQLADVERRRKGGELSVADVEAIRATVTTRRQDLETAERDLASAETEAAALAESVPEADLTATIRDATENVHALKAKAARHVADLEAQLGATARDFLAAQHETGRLLSLAKRAAQRLAEARGTTVASEYARAVEGSDVTPLSANPAPYAWPRHARGPHPDLAHMKPDELVSRYGPKG